MRFRNTLALTTLAATASTPILAEPREQQPGEGVLCLGTFIYFAEKTGSMCRPGEDSEFQSRVIAYSDRFDAYIIRNTGGDPEVLSQFKHGQNLDSEDRTFICEGDAAEMYDHFKAGNAAELDKAVDELLAKDGPPAWGDCV